MIVFIDRNNIQIDGSTEEVMPLEDLRGKWESFGWHVQEIDGHNIESVQDAVGMAKAISNRPSVVIAHTIPGKGVNFMEYDYRWHGAGCLPVCCEIAQWAINFFLLNKYIIQQVLPYSSESIAGD